MFDKELVRDILLQIVEAIGKLQSRTAHIHAPDYFASTPEGLEKLDAAAMLFVAIGESLKNVDRITGGSLLVRYPEIDWTGVKGLRDIIAHHYFDVDAEQVFWILKHNLEPLAKTIKRMIQELPE